MRFETFICNNKEFIVSVPDGAFAPAEGEKLPALYFCGGHDTDKLFLELEKKLRPMCKKGFPRFLMVSPADCEWDSDYSPWEAEIFGGRKFAGNADAFYSILKSGVIPYVEENFNACGRCIIGYSLGALAAAYCFTKDDFFDKCACISGSLWYPGWIDYINGIKLGTDGTRKSYFSLGKAEIKTRNSLMRENGNYYSMTSEVFSRFLGEKNVLFEWNNGGHGFEETERHIKALAFLYGNS